MASRRCANPITAMQSIFEWAQTPGWVVSSVKYPYSYFMLLLLCFFGDFQSLTPDALVSSFKNKKNLSEKPTTDSPGTSRTVPRGASRARS